ncbi:2-C-methyl-D-erythritol 4-phosphate cytidylyltransferase [Motilimonas sp. 1_MG-2023]|uniref:2-C-methyl-D-erythritol 4-phosphate cytidylyltransferase n=1 Tax=Motilimonas sp. 1_MG-2023 TaxID=3062672 RepID=UPI0026E3AF65|nr:2-C-methyl-D-erythritol 4-phosphate cytidylyltransferase [Motilimonas sp. 1_MG-2023]MDO6527672.1 2-C-methyl-D-erythritol 4-phosphate cytidylyltransferase [Motilimonas sp. 1_MG-2023]
MIKQTYAAILPAAGIGSRMQSVLPKQYLPLAGKTVIEHSLSHLIQHSAISEVVVVLAENDCWFRQLEVAKHPKITLAPGGAERCDSVLSGLHAIKKAEWVLVHDAARPCLTHSDIDLLIEHIETYHQGAILGTQVRDTMKRSDANGNILGTVDREHLWHALTPQAFSVQQLRLALESALLQGVNITDEASAIELSGAACSILPGRADNLKVTRPEDMAMAELFLTQSLSL